MLLKVSNDDDHLNYYLHQEVQCLKVHISSRPKKKKKEKVEILLLLLLCILRDLSPQLTLKSLLMYITIYPLKLLRPGLL